MTPPNQWNGASRKIVQLIAVGLSIGFAGFFATAVFENHSRGIRNEANINQFQGLRDDVREIRQILLEQRR